MLEKITFSDVKKVANDLIADDRLTVCKVLPKNS
jgi:predicted Zn-dependent peptidase